MRCPKCGSSAQVRIVWRDDEEYSNILYRDYECGCGCHFTAVYECTGKIIEKNKNRGRQNPYSML